jgi:hypothetical protein
VAAERKAAMLVVAMLSPLMGETLPRYVPRGVDCRQHWLKPAEFRAVRAATGRARWTTPKTVLDAVISVAFHRRHDSQNLPGMAVLRANGYDGADHHPDDFSLLAPFVIAWHPYGVSAPRFCMTQYWRYTAAIWLRFSGIAGIFCCHPRHCLPPQSADPVHRGVGSGPTIDHPGWPDPNYERGKREAALITLVTASGMTLFSVRPSGG